MLTSGGFTAFLGSLAEAGSLRGRTVGCRRIVKCQQNVWDSTCDSTKNFSKSCRPVKLSRKELRKKLFTRPLEDGVPNRIQCSSNVQSLDLGISPAEQVDQYLEKISNAVGLRDDNLYQHITVSGLQVLMGMEGQWRLTWNMDGRYYERYEGPELHFEWAYDDKYGPWCADAAGRVSALVLDDREVCLLASWVRTGYWLTDGGRKKLSIYLEKQRCDDREVTLTLKLKSSKVVAYLVVDNSTWLPLHMSIKAFGGEDKWEFDNWQPILPGHHSQFPRAILHRPPAGGNDIYSVMGVKVENFEERLAGKESGTSIYTKPTSKLVPRHTWSYPQTHINNGLPPVVEMVQAESRHYLVRPLVDGQDIGYFIVDTGASSLTISPEKATELGMSAFGEAYITGIEGEVKCQYRRAKSFQIGPLTIKDPMFMEVPMAGVVRGVSPVAGICGYDIFFHCIVEMSYKERTLSLYDPMVYCRPLVSPSQWQKMFLMENVPHVPATFNGNEAIFLLDTGAGGVDLIFHGRAVNRYKLYNILELAGTASLKGINSSGKGLQVQYGILDSLQVAGRSFRSLKALFPMGGTCGSLDISEYTAGVLCGDVLEDLLVLLDYGNQKFALIDNDEESNSSRSVV